VTRPALAKLRRPAIRVPRRFYDDHTERDLPAPGILKATRSHYWIDALSRDLPELLDDAQHYADPWGPDGGPGLRASARATAEAIGKHMAAQRAADWVVMRWQEGAESHGRAAWWHHGPGNWTETADLATRLPEAEAEQLASDWNDYAATKGRPERYRAQPATEEPQP
jgi:hypothetical protein